MKLELRVCQNTENARVYTVDTLDMSLGMVEDICDTLDIETISLTDKIDLAKRIMRSRKQITPILHDIFGATEEEIRTVRTSNLIEIFKEIYNYITESLESVPAGDSKNDERVTSP